MRPIAVSSVPTPGIVAVRARQRRVPSSARTVSITFGRSGKATGQDASSTAAPVYVVVTRPFGSRIRATISGGIRGCSSRRSGRESWRSSSMEKATRVRSWREMRWSLSIQTLAAPNTVSATATSASITAISLIRSGVRWVSTFTGGGGASGTIRTAEGGAARSRRRAGCG